MEYQYSTIVDPEIYNNEGLSNGISVRKHVFTHLEDRGAIRAQRNWARLVGPMDGRFKETLAPEWSFMTVSVPECLPERLEIISYANEFAFMHDGTDPPYTFFEQARADRVGRRHRAFGRSKCR
jgi:hypothetical protein